MSEPGEGQQNIVTIDGPSGVGKSTVSRRVAAELGYTYLDTGAMYRAVAYGCRQAGVDTSDTSAVKALLDNLDITLLAPESGGDDIRVLLNGTDISSAIRTPEMGMLASTVSALPPVRARLTAMQQAMGTAGQLVAEGRDTGTVVFPRAAWKFFLDAKPEERARRRIEQLRAKGEQVDEQELLAQIIKRDRDDRERAIAPLAKAADAVVVDTSHLNIDQVVVRMLTVIRAAN
jgi:cytidylate kinase